MDGCGELIIVKMKSYSISKLVKLANHKGFTKEDRFIPVGELIKFLKETRNDDLNNPLENCVSFNAIEGLIEELEKEENARKTK